MSYENELEIMEFAFRKKYGCRITKGKNGALGCPLCGEIDIDEDANPRSYVCGYNSRNGDDSCKAKRNY